MLRQLLERLLSRLIWSQQGGKEQIYAGLRQFFIFLFFIFYLRIAILPCLIVIRFFNLNHKLKYIPAILSTQGKCRECSYHKVLWLAGSHGKQAGWVSWILPTIKAFDKIFDNFQRGTKRKKLKHHLRNTTQICLKHGGCRLLFSLLNNCSPFPRFQSLLLAGP